MLRRSGSDPSLPNGKKAKKAGKSADGTMSLMEHLRELRRRLFFAVLGLLAGTILGFIWWSVAIPPLGLPSLGDLLKAPYCSVTQDVRVDFALSGASGEQCRLLATTPFSPLQIRLKAALLAGALISSPVWLLQLWGFVTPALYAKEKRYARSFVGAAFVLLMAGAVLAYIVIQHGLAILLGFGGDVTVSALTPDSYFGFLIGVMLIFGVSFLVPLLLVMLNFIGVLSGRRLAKSRRYSMFALVVFAGLTVPGNDPITMLVLAVALCVLYEMAVQVSLLHDRRKAKRLGAEGMANLADDEASPTPMAGAAVTADQQPIAADPFAPEVGATPIPAPQPIPSRRPQASPEPAAGPEPAPSSAPVPSAEPLPTPAAPLPAPAAPGATPPAQPAPPPPAQSAPPPPAQSAPPPPAQPASPPPAHPVSGQLWDIDAT
nr:twin-arginine translocase subunit TatC [Nakamurella aerolata]